MTPLPRAHPHNDYWRKRPLQDALECGFCSVEADTFLVGDQLLVGHDPHELRPERTLESLYLAPLRERARQFRGRIYPDAPHFYLLTALLGRARHPARVGRPLGRRRRSHRHRPALCAARLHVG
jgi:hypothetical protein